MSSNPDEPRSHAWTGCLLNNESEVQQSWDENDVFEADAGSEPPGPGEKFFWNFPYPYMNGLLHLGFAFSLSKLEFGVAYHRLCGSNAILSFAFHCTGMPIKASADKLAREIQQFGNPPVVAQNGRRVLVLQWQMLSRLMLLCQINLRARSPIAPKAGAHKYQWEQGLLLIFLTNQLV